jgi:hypothetical protein
MQFMEQALASGSAPATAANTTPPREGKAP